MSERRERKPSAAQQGRHAARELAVQGLYQQLVNLLIICQPTQHVSQRNPAAFGRKHLNLSTRRRQFTPFLFAMLIGGDNQRAPWLS